MASVGIETTAPPRPAAPVVDSTQELQSAPQDHSAPARWISRFLATLLDNLILSIPVGILMMVGLGIAGASLIQSSSNPVSGASSFDPVGTITGLMLPVVIAMIVPVLYVFLTMRREGPKHGQTVGKGVTGVRIICLDGSPVQNKEILMRELVGKIILLYLGAIILTVIVSQISSSLASLVTLLYFLGWFVLMPWRDPYNRCPHDLVAGTKPIQA